MKVADILERKGHHVYTIAPNRTLWDAASMLAERNIGALIVANDDSGMLGIITERDLAREVCRRPERLRSAKVRDAMTSDVASCHAHDSVRAVETLFRGRSIRHLPVYENKRLVGIISMRDVLAALYRATVDDANELRDQLARHYVVC